MPTSCLYCGKALLLPHANPHAPIKSDCDFVCPACGLRFSKNEVDRENKRLETSHAAGSANEDEEIKILDSAWQLMQKRQWQAALDQMSQCGRPFKHPLEFLFYREICQAAPLLSCGKTELDKRYLLLDIIINNIACLDQFLPEDDKELTFSIHQRLFEAFMLFGDLPSRRHTKYLTRAKIDTTNFRRTMILSSFADIAEMETIGNKQYRPDYLKMSVQLLHKCLYLAQENKHKYIICFYHQLLQIPQESRCQINAKIEQLNADISKLDPGFTPSQPLPLPKIIPPHVLKLSGISFIGVGLLIILGFCVYILIATDSGFDDYVSLAEVFGAFVFYIIMVFSSKKEQP